MSIKTGLYKIFMPLVILAILFPPFAYAVPSAHAQTSSDDIRRADMMQIAQRYVSHAWNAAPNNVIHGKKPLGRIPGRWIHQIHL